MRPFITIEKRAREALAFYEATFPSYSLESIQQHAEPHQDLVMLATFSVKGQAVMISDSFVEHEWSITPGISFFIDAASEEDLNRLANALWVDGKVHMPAGKYGISTLFAWVEDRFGVNWRLNLG
jgi:predicted 3-demethylubiquinone-9 3-methyltransferase (glyoxalase superfamily)